MGIWMGCSENTWEHESDVGQGLIDEYNGQSTKKNTHGRAPQSEGDSPLAGEPQKGAKTVPKTRRPIPFKMTSPKKGVGEPNCCCAKQFGDTTVQV